MAAFRYRLAPLLRFEEASLRPLRQTLLGARQRMEDERAGLAALQTEAAACAQALPALAADAEIYLSALGFLRELHQRQRRQQGVVDEAEARWHAAEEAVKTARSRVRQLEKHRERQRHAHCERVQKREYREMDEAWLRRSREKELA